MIAAALLLLVSCRRAPSDGLWAIPYGQSTFPAQAIQAGADPDERWPFSWQVWLIRDSGRWVLVDTGFDDEALARRRSISPYRTVPDALRADLGLSAEDITDVVITHGHWDHVGGVSAYPAARVWIQGAELRWMQERLSDGRARRGGLRQADLEALEAIRGAGRLNIIEGDASVTDAVDLHRGGGHTPGVQWVSYRDAVLTSDIAYLARNLTEGTPRSSHDRSADQRAVDEIQAREPARVVPGHDPAVLSGPMETTRLR